MIVTLILTVIFVFMAFYSALFVQRAILRYFLLLSYIGAILFVWNPNITTKIANIFGMGRGLDFILVLFSVAIINGMFFIIKHLNSQHQSITKLARHIAIRDARHNPSAADSDDKVKK